MQKSRHDSKKLSNLYEEMVSADVVGGGEGHGGDVGNSDWYAPGDARNPFYLGVRSRWKVYDPEKEREEKEKKPKKKGKKIQNENYSYTGNCISYEDGMDVQNITGQDDYSYPESTGFHDPEMQISKDEFEELTGFKLKSNQLAFYNSYCDVVFSYNKETDIHDFFEKS